MLNVGKIDEGFVLDHIPVGKGMSIYYHLGLDKLDCMVAIIKNAHSKRLGRKDIREQLTTDSTKHRRNSSERPLMILLPSIGTHANLATSFKQTK